MGRWVLAVGVVAVTFAGAVVVVRAQRTTGPARSSITSESIVMLGDSITQEGDWGSLLPDHAVANRGFSGFTTADLVAEAESVAASGPAAVFVLAGTNDIRDGLPSTTTAENLGAILDRFAEISPDSSIVVQTVLPRRDAVRGVEAANEEVRRLADDRGVRLLDLHPAFDNGSGGLRVEETTDGIHLAEAGYRRWRDLLVPTLEAIGVPPR